MKTTQQEIINLVASITEIDASLLTGESAVGDFPNWDSLAQISIVTTLEKQFNTTFDEDATMDLESIDDLVNLVNQISE